MKFTCCPKCGNKLEENNTNNGETFRFCTDCQIPYYDNPTPCVITLVLNEKDEILLLKSHYISKTRWTLVAGFVETEETLEEAAKREILEETGQIVESLTYVQSYFFKPKDLIMAGFIARVTEKPFCQSNEVDEHMWCNPKSVDDYINRENNVSGTHFDNCLEYLNQDPKVRGKL